MKRVMWLKCEHCVESVKHEYPAVVPTLCHLDRQQYSRNFQVFLEQIISKADTYTGLRFVFLHFKCNLNEWMNTHGRTQCTSREKEEKPATYTNCFANWKSNRTQCTQRVRFTSACDALCVYVPLIILFTLGW